MNVYYKEFVIMAVSRNAIVSPVQIYALGGLGEVGKNLYCVENDNSLLIVDCGVMFPENTIHKLPAFIDA